MKPAEAAPMIPLTCTLPMIPLTVTITLFWTPHGLAHYLKESPCLSNSIRKRCVSLPGRFFVFILIWFLKKKSALSLSLCLFHFSQEEIFIFFPYKTALCVHNSGNFKYLNFSKLHYFQAFLFSCSLEAFRGGCPGARGQRLSFASALHVIQTVLLMTSFRNHLNCTASTLGVLIPCQLLLSTFLSTKGTGCENRWKGKSSPVLITSPCVLWLVKTSCVFYTV